MNSANHHVLCMLTFVVWRCFGDGNRTGLYLIRSFMHTYWFIIIWVNNISPFKWLRWKQRIVILMKSTIDVDFQTFRGTKNGRKQSFLGIATLVIIYVERFQCVAPIKIKYIYQWEYMCVNLKHPDVILIMFGCGTLSHLVQ